MQNALQQYTQSVLFDPGAFLRNLTLGRGARPVYGRYVMHAAEILANCGIALEFADCHALKVANRTNPGSWMPLVPMFDPSFNEFDESNLVTLIGRDRHGDVVSANAIRLYDWRRSDFLQEAESLRLMYANPEIMARQDERCHVTSLAARSITGYSAFSGAAWVHPTYRHLGIGQVLPVLIKVLAVCEWTPNIIFGMMSEKVYQRGFSKRFGFENESWEANWINSIDGTLRLAILWASTNYIAEHVGNQLGAVNAKIDTRIIK